MVDEAVAEVKADRDAQFAAAKAAVAERNAPVPFADDQYLAATVVRTKLGWYRVVKVSAKSVTVETGYSWNDRISRSKIIEVR